MAWAYLPDRETGSASAPGPAASILDSCSQNPDFTRDAGSNGKNTRATPSSQDNGLDTSPRRRSGMMSPPSTGGHSGARSTPSLQGIRASLSAQPDSAAATPTSATYGPRLPGSSVRSIQSGYSSKTSQVTSASALKPCCEAYGAWAERLRLAYSRRAKQARRMKGSACSSWPTAVANDDNKTPEAHLAMKKRMGERDGTNANRTAITSLQVAVKAWPTPAARDHKGENSPDQLPNAVAFLYSRPDPETAPHGPESSEWRPISRRLFRSAMSSVSPITVRRWLRRGGVAEAEAQSRVCRATDGLAQRPRALRIIGNGVCPLAAGYAWRSLASAHGLGPVDMEAAGGQPAARTDEPVVTEAHP